jgi:hypothetical protein
VGSAPSACRRRSGAHAGRRFTNSRRVPFFLIGVQGTKRVHGRVLHAVINSGGAGGPATACHFELHAMVAREAAATSSRNWRSTAANQQRRRDYPEECRSGCMSSRTTHYPRLQGSFSFRKLTSGREPYRMADMRSLWLTPLVITDWAEPALISRVRRGQAVSRAAPNIVITIYRACKVSRQSTHFLDARRSVI